MSEDGHSSGPYQLKVACAPQPSGRDVAGRPTGGRSIECNDIPLPLDAREIGDVRPRAEVLEQLAAARRRGEARDLALRVLEVAEDERARGAPLRARRLDLAVTQR